MDNISGDISKDKTIFFLFFLIPTIMLIVGYYIYPFPPSQLAQQLVLIPLFLGLISLGIGYLLKKQNVGSKVKMIGWGMFSFYWATAPSHLYFSEGGDVFNAAVSIIGVYVLIYFAYHEWLSIAKGEHPSCLDWVAGGAFIAGIIYFTIDNGIFPELKSGLIEVVAAQTNWLLNLLGIETILKPDHIIEYNNEPILIIFACTAIQAIVLFIGMIVALKKVNITRRFCALLITVIPIYILNLVRNASVVYLIGGNITSFHIAHNVLAKIGALITLIILLFITFKILPELYDEIVCLVDLPKRNGPVEKILKKCIWGKK